MAERSAVVPLCATGWSVKPKPVHTTASARIIAQSRARVGISSGCSKMSAATMASTAIVQTWAMPIASVSPPPWLSRSVSIIAPAYSSAVSIQSSSPGPMPAPGLSVSSPTPVSESSALAIVTQPGSFRVAIASSSGTSTTEVFSRNDAVLVAVYLSPKSSLVSTAKNAAPMAMPFSRLSLPAARTRRQNSASSSTLAVENLSAMSVNGVISDKPSLLKSSDVLRVIMTAASSSSLARLDNLLFILILPRAFSAGLYGLTTVYAEDILE